MYANLALDLEMAKYIIEKITLKLCEKSPILENMNTEKSGGTGMACRMLRISRSSFKYKSKKNDNYILEKLNKLAVEHPREGFWKGYYRLRNAGDKINHKRLPRVYKQIGLPLRRKVKKRLPQRVKDPLTTPLYFTPTWSIDFVHDVLENGRKFRSFNVKDDFNK